ncbi:MAG: ShlB/FhaC/HecB family hemolysin secretion/activation protein [Novosphingobium sp.]|uniref:ShlB/FhaC/HecB family hemolysin secretion/activation protein n=1 Tax=Novosphingobium sp. TaxID=1874826 RepID=UPI003016F9BC
MSCRDYKYSRVGALLASLAGAALLCAPSARAQEAEPAAPQPPAQAETGGDAGAVPERFTVEAIDVVGATVLTADEIENAVYPYTGENKTPADLEAARKALQDVYAAKGYEAAVVDLPPQDNARFAQGYIQIRVSEAPVGEVRVAGTKFHSEEGVRAQLPAVEAGKPINLAVLQKQLAEANRIPDRTVTPSFKPSKTEGAIDVELKVKDTFPVHGSLEVNNDNSPNTDRLRLAASLRYTNLWGKGHTISGSYIVAPRDRRQTEVISGSYNAPLLGTPLSLVLFGFKSNSNIAALGGTQVLGNGYQIGARAIYRLAGEKADQSFSLGFDYKDFKQNIVVKGELASQAPIRYIPLVLGYSYSRPSDKGEFELNLGATLGLRVVKRLVCADLTQSANCSLEDQLSLRDFNARENFAHVNLDLSYSRLIADDVSLIFKLAGQYADGHLVSNEQFGLGGESSVRGYFQSEAVGDRGVVGTVQLDGPSLAGSLPDFVGELRPYVFVDYGVVGIINPLADQRSRFTLGSAGGGVRLRLFKHLVGGVTVGVPFTSLTDTRRGTARVVFTARGEF